MACVHGNPVYKCHECATAIDQSMSAALKRQRVGLSITREEAACILSWWHFIEETGEEFTDEDAALVKRLGEFVDRK
jgi:hypothetical protein